MPYFGERENGPPQQDQEAITPAAWQGIVAVIQTALRTARFAENFPDRACIDHGLAAAITGCNEGQFYARLKGEHPSINVPLDPQTIPDTVAALEVLEFCYRYVSLPKHPTFHDYYAHSHYLYFSREEGQAEFREQINAILRRNHLAFELLVNGEIRRIIPPVLREALSGAEFRSEDPDLNRLLDTARTKFGDPDFHTRYDALKVLWDAFERLKTLEPPHEDKRASATALIARVSPEAAVREMLDAEMRKDLNDIGNGFFIRHAGADQVSLQTSEEIDYLFHRLFAVIRLLLRSTGRGG
jgi:hypothetical protein